MGNMGMKTANDNNTSITAITDKNRSIDASFPRVLPMIYLYTAESAMGQPLTVTICRSCIRLEDTVRRSVPHFPSEFRFDRDPVLLPDRQPRQHDNTEL